VLRAYRQLLLALMATIGLLSASAVPLAVPAVAAAAAPGPGVMAVGDVFTSSIPWSAGYKHFPS
jgi:hypothetical protein